MHRGSEATHRGSEATLGRCGEGRDGASHRRDAARGCVGGGAHEELASRRPRRGARPRRVQERGARRAVDARGGSVFEAHRAGFERRRVGGRREGREVDVADDAVEDERERGAAAAGTRTVVVVACRRRARTRRRWPEREVEDARRGGAPAPEASETSEAPRLVEDEEVATRGRLAPRHERRGRGGDEGAPEMFVATETSPLAAHAGDGRQVARAQAFENRQTKSVVQEMHRERGERSARNRATARRRRR